MARTRNTQAASETATSEAVAVTTDNVKTEKRVFKAEDTIPCRSVTSGSLKMIGIKSGIDYYWSGRDDVTDVEYQDLAAAIRASKKQLTNPNFIILDDDFLNEFPQIKRVYEGLYDMEDFEKILSLPPNQMYEVITKLPNGLKETIKSIASDKIGNGELDSMSRIKMLDKIFHTNLTLMTEFD